MDKLLERYNLPKLTEEEKENLNRTITRDWISNQISTESPGTDDFFGEFYQMLNNKY